MAVTSKATRESTARRLTALLEQALDVEMPVRVRAWDGSEAGPPDGPVLVVRRRRALRRLLWQPDELGLGRAWVSGDLDIDGDLYDALHRFDRIAAELKRAAPASRTAVLGDPRIRQALREAAALGALGPPPRPPEEEARTLRGGRHTRSRDREVIHHHYDVGNRFYELLLGSSMVYSCAYWRQQPTPGGYTLADAQHDKLDLVCRKLGLQPGQRLLDVGCGWGTMALHAARTYQVDVVAVTLSEEQAHYARQQVAAAGLSDRVDIRVQDYREITDGPYDAISSIGMAEHVGAAQYRVYAQDLHALLRPGGRLLNHQISRRPDRRRPDGSRAPHRLNKFIAGYVFPDGELAPVGGTVALLEEAGFEVRDLQALREHYAETLRAWVDNLRASFDEAERLTSPARARVWLLYMAASALSFETNRIGVNQVLAVRPTAEGDTGLNRVRDF